VFKIGLDYNGKESLNFDEKINFNSVNL